MNYNPYRYIMRLYHSKDLTPREFKLINFWLPFFFNRIKIDYVSDDFKDVNVILKHTYEKPGYYDISGYVFMALVGDPMSTHNQTENAGGTIYCRDTLIFDGDNIYAQPGSGVLVNNEIVAINFVKNLGIIAGLLILSASNPGKYRVRN